MLMLFLAAIFPHKVFAQFPYSESFMNSAAPGMNFGGSPVANLTSGNQDPSGNGYLRLTTNGASQKGYAFNSNSFPASRGISVNFEYYTYGGNGADGICFFLFDAAVADGSFNVGSFGGGLGYTNVTSTGLSRAYLGIGLDEFGNFSDAGAGGNGGTGRVANSVTIRGAYNDSRGAYYMLTTVPVQTNYGFPIGSSGSTRPTTGGTGYRKAFIDIMPHSGGPGFDITVKIQHDAVSAPVTIINNYYYNYASPSSLKFGFAASTGGSNNYHEIRNTSVSLPAGTTLATPTQTNQTITTCSNSTGSVNVSGGFSTTNSPNGAINTSSVDLDPTTSGIQTTYTVASKGTFTSDGNGNITFTPLNSTVTGNPSCSFTVADNYGATSNTATVVATVNPMPTLTVTNPAAVCSPATINLTASAVTAGSDANLTLTFYTDAAATATLSNPPAVASSGTYYIKAVNANGCSVIRPVTVTINPQPITASAGLNQSITAATPTTATLNGNSPSVGTGLWSQVSGPTTATFANTTFYNTGVSNLNPGTYVFRWTITNSCGASTSDVNITVTGTQTITFAALPAKAYGDADFNAGATASSGLAVAYTSSNPAVATVDATGLIRILTVGTTNITASQSGNSNYAAATPVVRTLTVNKAPQTITFAALPASTYNDPDFNAGATASSGLAINYVSSNPAVATVSSGGLVHILSAGSTTVTASQPGNGSYNAATSVTQILTVNKASQVITFAALPAKTYNDPDFNAGATASSGLAVTYVSSNPAVATVNSAGLVHIMTVGATDITASQPGNGSYNAATPVTQTLTVNKAPQTITFAALPASTYNDPDFNVTATASSGLAVNYVSSNPAVATVSPGGLVHILSAGSATITASQPGNGSYNAATSVAQILTVNKALPIITFNALPAKTYGNADFNPNATSSNSTVPVTYASSNTSVATIVSGNIHIVGAGTAVITASQAANSNYNAAAPVQQTLTVNPVALTITANNQSKTYGSADPVFTVGYSGFVNGDTQASLTTPPTVGTSATATSGVGTYPITASGAASANYTISYTSGTFSIYPGIQTISFNAPPKTYGDPDFTLSASASSGLPVTYSSSNPAVATVDAQGNVHIVSAGYVIITASQPGNGNYIATTNINQQLTINKAALAIAADNQTSAYGSAIPPLTVSYAGFVNGDTQASLTTPPTANTTATAASAVGTYPITVSGAVSSNYTITYQQGIFTVAPNNQTITFASIPAKTYGDADFNLSASASSGSVIAYNSSDPTIATVDATGKVHILSAGTAIITASQTGNNNYQAAADVQQTLTVNQAPLTLTAVNQTKTYGSTNPTLTVTYTGFVNGEGESVLTAQPSITTAATAASPAGTYPIAISAATASNYNMTYAAGTLTVNPAALTITADNKTKTPGAANPALTLTYNGFVNGDDATSLSTQPTLSTTATATSATGTYDITVSGAASANYNITYVAGTFTVTNPTISSVSLALATVFENQPLGTLAGNLSAASFDPNATYTYTLVSGAGSADNASFSIQGNKLVTAKSLDFEQKSIYSILVRATNQYGLYLDQIFTINLSDVNEAPTLAAIANQQICSANAAQTIALNGITPGPETAQSTALSVSSDNPGLFTNLAVSSVTGGTATLTYQLAGTGTAMITVTVKDNGGTANGGTDSFSQTFSIKANELPVAMVNSDKGLQISKGETVTLTAIGGNTYSWNTSPNVGGTSSSAVVKFRPSQTTTYQVTASNASGCSSTASITINVTDDYSILQPANILTPNGDGKNDTWVVKNLDLYPNNTVSIFDKGGRLLNKVSHYNNDWDGTYNGAPLAEGTYYYVIDFGPGKGLIKGFITILRNR